MISKIKRWIYTFAKKIIAKRINEQGNSLRPNDLLAKGWVELNGYYMDLNIKNDRRITIKFEDHYYRVWHGSSKTFIALENTREWLDIYFLLIYSEI